MAELAPTESPIVLEVRSSTRKDSGCSEMMGGGVVRGEPEGDGEQLFSPKKSYEIFFQRVGAPIGAPILMHEVRCLEQALGGTEQL